MKCPYCDKEIKESDIKCPHCFALIPIIEESNEKSNKENKHGK